MRREKSIDLRMLFDYKYRILRAKMIEMCTKLCGIIILPLQWVLTMQSGTKS